MSSTAMAVQSERRAATRSKSFFRAQILDGKGLSTLDCLLRDMSETGARLSLSGFPLLPKSFDLRVLGRNATRRAWLVWRGYEVIGISFADPLSPQAVMAKAIRALEEENKLLESHLLDLTQRLENRAGSAA